ncbi:MAG TPA: 2-phospho-L-lactate transferase CofD family protein, partial [Roseiflexaceae bacterium]|nr:2-phospho-L-lactate transferase CofD family protein [Roseiflexaceae bacterium]
RVTDGTRHSRSPGTRHWIGMRPILKRLSSLTYLARPLALTFVGIVLLSLGVAYLFIALYRTVELPAFFSILTLQFLPRYLRGLLLVVLGLVALAFGLWHLSGLAVIPLSATTGSEDELVLSYERAFKPPRIAVLSGGPGMLILAGLGRHVERMTCITPVQDPVEYYYRASSLFNFENVYYVAPTPTTVQVEVELDDGTRRDIKQNISHDELLASHHVAKMRLLESEQNNGFPPLSLTRLTLDALREADAIILGPGSLFESILPNLLIPELREAIKASQGRKIYICNLMTEPGLTAGFSVAEHIRQIVRYGGFAPDYVLVNAQRIEPDVRQIYQAANQSPVYLDPEEYEETIVSATDRVTSREVVVEGAVVIEADLAASQLQLTASLERPGERRTVRVLRHDPDKLANAILEILRRG